MCQAAVGCHTNVVNFTFVTPTTCFHWSVVSATILKTFSSQRPLTSLYSSSIIPNTLLVLIVPVRKFNHHKKLFKHFMPYHWTILTFCSILTTRLHHKVSHNASSQSIPQCFFIKYHCLLQLHTSGDWSEIDIPAFIYRNR